jgi:hypothetical protein
MFARKRTASIGSMVAGCTTVAALLGAGSPAGATTFASAPHLITSERTDTPWYAIPNEALGGLTPNAYVARHQERVMDLVEHYYPVSGAKD